jgi:hypothetical protein
MTHDVSVRGAGEGTSPGLTDHRRPVVVPGPCRIVQRGSYIKRANTLITTAPVPGLDRRALLGSS